jgi:hypothetical protein
MRKFILLITILTLKSVLNANEPADTTYWKTDGSYAINFTQVSLTNWASGGQNSVAGVTKLQYSAKYSKGNIQWDNLIDLGYGLSKIEGLVTQKNEDIIDLQSKLGIKASEKWNYSASLGFKSQFAPGYSDANNTVKTSNLLAPANITMSLGMDYKPASWFSLMLSPAAGKLTIVNDPDIDASNYGLASSDATTRFEAGASLKALLNSEIFKNVNLSSELGLFSNYFDNPENIDIDWKVAINMKINDYLSAQIDTRLIYDENIKDPTDGLAKVQFKQMLGIGLNFKF